MKHSLYVIIGACITAIVIAGDACADMRVIESNSPLYPVGASLAESSELQLLKPGQSVTVVLESGKTRTFRSRSTPDYIPFGATEGGRAPR